MGSQRVQITVVQLALASVELYQAGAVEQEISGPHTQLGHAVALRAPLHHGRVVDGLDVAARARGDQHRAQAASPPSPPQCVLAAPPQTLAAGQLSQGLAQLTAYAFDYLVGLQVCCRTVDEADKTCQGDDHQQQGSDDGDAGAIGIAVAGHDHQAVEAGSQEHTQAYLAVGVTEELAQYLGSILPGSQGQGDHGDGEHHAANT